MEQICEGINLLATKIMEYQGKLESSSVAQQINDTGYNINIENFELLKKLQYNYIFLHLRQTREGAIIFVSSNNELI